MNNKYDIIIVGGGIAGCCAALKANEYGAKTLILEQSKNILDIPRPHREFLLLRDFNNLNIELSDNSNLIKGYKAFTGSKMSIETDYPGDFRFVFMNGNVILSRLNEIVKSKNNISYVNSSQVIRLLYENNKYIGVEILSGEKFYSKTTIICTGLNSIEQFKTQSNEYWPRKLTKFNKKIKVSRLIQADKQKINNVFQNTAYWFYQKNMFCLHSLIPIVNHISCESHYADITKDEAIQNIKNFFNEHPLVKKLFSDIDLENTHFNIQIYDDFGVRLPTSFDGLLIAGNAMNISSPVFLYDIYATIYTGCLAGELSGGSKSSDSNISEYNYEKIWMENLVGLKLDFEIIESSSDQFDALLKWMSSVIEHFDKYYQEIMF